MQDDAVNQVLVDEPLADVAFLVLVLRAGAASNSAGVENDGGTALPP
jgi:hypothetical protein